MARKQLIGSSGHRMHVKQGSEQIEQNRAQWLRHGSSPLARLRCFAVSASASILDRALGGLGQPAKRSRFTLELRPSAAPFCASQDSVWARPSAFRRSKNGRLVFSDFSTFSWLIFSSVSIKCRFNPSKRRSSVP